LTTPGKCALHLIGILDNVHEKAKHDFGFSYPADHPIILTAFSRGVLVLNHVAAEYATLVSPQSETPYVLDWQGSKNDVPLVSLPTWEPNLSILTSKTSSAEIFSQKDKTLNFMNRVKAIHYIDGHRFPTNRAVCLALSKFTEKNNVRVNVHTSPRQVKSTSQPWIPMEFDIFVRYLEENSAKFTHKMYFEDKPKKIEWHFRVLDELQVTEE